jgi:hypothetical protein
MADKVAIKQAQTACFLPSTSEFAQFLLCKFTHNIIIQRNFWVKSENDDVICETNVPNIHRIFAVEINDKIIDN